MCTINNVPEQITIDQATKIFPKLPDDVNQATL